MEATHSEKPICTTRAPARLWVICVTLPLKAFHCCPDMTEDGFLSSFQRRALNASSFFASLPHVGRCNVPCLMSTPQVASLLREGRYDVLGVMSTPQVASLLNMRRRDVPGVVSAGSLSPHRGKVPCPWRCVHTTGSISPPRWKV